MSKKSWILLFIMCSALIYMGALRAYQWYQHRLEIYNEKHPAPVRLVQTEEESLPNEGVPLEQWTPVREDIFLEQQTLSEELQEQQARETIASILNDFQMNPALIKFNRELEQATKGEVRSLEELSNRGLELLLEQHPEIQEVVNKNGANENFAAVLKQIFSNPQYQQSVQKLQGGKVPRSAE
ncbi:MAG: hypothetical protein J5601_00410 [Elusimicrobiaceae bacterium]|nr:hypothetical protein [Elusimicrobiaceae bacterium]